MSIATGPHACVDCQALPDPSPSDDVHARFGVDVRPLRPRAIDPRSTPRRPRCTSHWRAADRDRKARARATQRAARRGVPAELQQALWEFQGRACPCGAKPGPIPPAGVPLDHDHDLAREQCDHDPDKGCPACVLGFLCTACNRDVIGRFSSRRSGRAGVSTILRALAEFLDDPPLPRLLAEQAATERTAS